MNKSKKKEIIELVKEAWKEDIDSINNMEVLKKDSKKYLGILKTIESMYEPKDECVVEETEEVEQEKQTLKSDRDNYIFSRKLNSGMGLNHELEEIVYVPEKIVRQLNLKHGEVFRCERNGL